MKLCFSGMRKPFYNRPGLFVKFKDSQPVEEIKSALTLAEAYTVNYVGINLTLDGFAIESASGDAAKFAAAVNAARSVSQRPFILMSKDADVMPPV